MTKDADHFFDYIGVGIGPANLSLAALSAEVPSLRSRFYDRAREFVWHAGLLFPESVIQTSYLKDLVTAVDPTNKHSFLSFLVAHKRFYSFLTASFPQVTRAEFSQYLAWVSRSLPNLEFDAPVLEVKYHDDLFHVRTNKSSAHANDLVLGTGQVQHVPEFARPHLGHGVYHSNQFGLHKPAFAGRRVAVIGGGQAGAELVNHFLTDSRTLPSSLLWVSRRENFLPLDDSPFTNELFTPEFAEYFYHQMDGDSKSGLLERQKLASDGVSQSLLQDIYRRLYMIQFVERRPRMAHLLPSHKLTSIRRTATGLAITLRSAAGQPVEREADLVLLATGHHYRLPECLEPLKHRIHRVDNRLSIREDYSLEWDGPSDRRIFVQNAARHSRGLADPNLSLLAWRSATIVNRLAGRMVYDCAPADSVMEWPSASRAAEARQEAHQEAHQEALQDQRYDARIAV